MRQFQLQTKNRLPAIMTGLVLFGVAITTPNAAELAEITVTARKREVALQDAAIAVAVVSGDDFERSNIVKLDNFNGFAPGLVVAKNDGAGRIITIRGVGWETAQNLASQPSVLTYIDGIFLANPLSAGIDLGELERVEIFRGPQGTEFGQGTTGGSINLVSKRPKLDELNGYIEAGYGTFETSKVRAALNIPLGDTAAIRGALQKYDRDGFAEIKGGTLDGYDLDDADSITGKLSLLWEPVENLSIFAQGFIQDSDQNAAAQKNIDDPHPDPRKLTQDYPGTFALQNYSASLIVEWETVFGVTMRSLTGWQRLRKDQSVDGDRLTEATFSQDLIGFFTFNNYDVLPFFENDSDAISQEINLTYSGEKLDWVAGFYYLDHKNYNNFLEVAGPAPFTAVIASLAKPDPRDPLLTPFGGMSVLLFNEYRTVTREDLAVYGQASFRFNDTFAATAGVRYQTEEQQDKGAQFFSQAFNRTTKDSQVTWKAGLDVRLSEDNLVYALVSTGWKNGGTNPGSITQGAQFGSAAFKAEKVLSYEIGSRNSFFDNTVRFNLTAFYYDHENLQFIFEDPVPFAGGTEAIPKVEEYGIETEFSWQIDDAWRVDGFLSWQDGKIKSDFFALDVAEFRAALMPGLGLFNNGAATREALALANNLKGNEPAKLPDIIARLSVSNTYTFSHGSTLDSRIDYIHRGSMQARVFNHPAVDKIPSYHLVNVNFTYHATDYPLTVALGITNLFDKNGINNTFTNPFGSLTTSTEFIPPREVIATIRYDWH